MNLATFMKANGLAGLIGTVVFTPFAYAYEFFVEGPGSPLLSFGLVDLAMLLIAPVLMGMAFALTALTAYPVVAYLQRRGILDWTDSTHKGASGEV